MRTIKNNLVLSIVVFTIFWIQPFTTNCSAQYTKLHDFIGFDGTNFVDGQSPKGDLLLLNNVFYGMTVSGGKKADGMIFKINSDGTGYTDLYDFPTSLNTYLPSGSLITDGTFLYGLTTQGGANGLGAIFKIMTDGTGYINILNFNSSNGQSPEGSLIFDGTFLYGMTYGGGANGGGLIYKVKTDGTGYSTILDFAGTNGWNPMGSLYSDGTYLYGMTEYGGTNNIGVIFKIKKDGTGYLKLLDFAGTTNGSRPYNSTFISDGTYLYGMTYMGGANSYGCVFKIKTDGTGYLKLQDFNVTTTGTMPYSSLVYDGKFLYGMTLNSGLYLKGTIFKIKPDGTGFSTMLNFNGATNGANPYGSLIFDGTFLCGMTFAGGSNDHGTIFKYNTCTVDTVTQSLTLCAGQNIKVGNHIYSASGTYRDTLVNVSSCDSIVKTVLTVNSDIDVSVLVSGITLTANASPATYEWVDCNNGNAPVPVAGETNKSFITSSPGSYAVIVTQNGCSKMSNCYSVTTTAIIQNSIVANISIYPNPFTSETTLSFNQNQNNVTIKITDLLGKQIRSIIFSGTKLTIDRGEMKAGIYLLQIIDDNKKIINREFMIQ